MVLRLGAVVDVLSREDESIVLTATQCLRLTAVPTAIVELLTEPRTVGWLSTALEDRFGPAPVGRIDEVLAELQRQGVVIAGSDEARSDES